RDVYEAASFFVYNTILAERCRYLDPILYPITNTDGRTAYKSSAVAARLAFVEKICSITIANNHKLFLAELPTSGFVGIAHQLRELRNNLSHTATQTESQIKNLLEIN